MQEIHPLATKNVALSPLAMFLKIDQLAFLARTDEDVASIKKMLRLEEANWVEDEVAARGYVRGAGDEATNFARLLFNYDLGIEVEILRYLNGANYPDIGEVPSCKLAHIGMHVDKGEKIPVGLVDFVFAFPIIQQVETIAHTNEFLINTGRKYRYTIYDTRELLGVYLKVIERLEQEA
jgi:hypothetical protein